MLKTLSLIGNGLGILASQLLIARMEKKGTVSRTSVVMSTSAGYIPVSYTHLTLPTITRV